MTHFLPHAYWLELLPLVFGLFGWFITLQSFRDSWSDYKRIEGLPESATSTHRVILAQAVVTSTAMMFVVQGLIVVASIAAIFLPPPPPNYSEVPQSLVSLVCWTAISGALVLQSLYGWMIRKRIFGARL